MIYAGTDVSPAPEIRVAGAAPLDIWIHAAATFDGSVMRLYQNGREVGMTALTRALPTDTTPLYIGTNKNPQRNDVFWGVIDEVAPFSVALPPAAIATLAAGTPASSL